MVSYVRMIIMAALRPSMVMEDIPKQYKVILTEKQQSNLEQLAKGTHVKIHYKGYS